MRRESPPDDEMMDTIHEVYSKAELALSCIAQTHTVTKTKAEIERSESADAPIPLVLSAGKIAKGVWL